MWRRLLALAVLVSLAAHEAAAAAPQDPYEATNRALQGHSATIALADGTEVKWARRVVVGPESTSWRGVGPRVTTVPTARVRSIHVLRSRFWSTFGGSVAVGAGVAGLGAMSVRNDGFGANRIVIAAASLAGGLLFGVVLGAVRRVPGEVVYQQPVETHASAAPAGDRRERLQAILRASFAADAAH